MGSFKVHRYEPTVATSLSIKTLRNIIFQYPYLIYGRGMREMWFQYIGSSTITVFYFDANIAGMDNKTKVRPLSDKDVKIGLVLDYFDYYQIGSVDLKEKRLNIFKRKVMKDEIPASKVKAFYRIKMHNRDRKRLEEAVILHMKETLIALSLEDRFIQHEIKKKLSKANIVTLRDDSGILFWEPNGSYITKLKTPYDPTSKKGIIKVYEATDDLRLVKTTIVNEQEVIYIVDEPKYIKLCHNTDTKLKIFKEYFVDNYFAYIPDVSKIKNYSYANNMMYSNNGGIILQQKYREVEGLFEHLLYGQNTIDYYNTKFPLCSDDYILYALEKEYEGENREEIYQYLLLAPPMNSHRIKQKNLDERNEQEFFFAL